MLAKFTLKTLIAFNLLNWFYLTGINAQEAKPRTQYSKSQLDNLFLQVLSVLPEHKIPVEFRAIIPEPSFSTCATIVLTEARQNLHLFSPEQQAILNEILQRPKLPQFYISSDRRFKIHYAETGVDAVPSEDLDGSGVPDFVEEVAKAFEKSYQVEVVQLGYREHPADNGIDGPEFDVYIEELGSRLYGFTQGEGAVPETPQKDLVSYIVIDNDFSRHFTKGIRGAQVTAAHEYFHAIQFGYRNFFNDDEKFYYELGSVWMEDVVYDDVNDYYQYLPTFFQRPDIPFNMFDAAWHYLGEALCNHFLVKKYERNDGGFNIIRRTWELMQSDVLVLDAIDLALKEKGSGFANDFLEFAFWNYFTGSRANPTSFYEEGAAYPEITFNGEFELAADISVVDSSLSLSYKYYKFTTGLSEEFSITGTLSEPENWGFAVITQALDSQPNLHLVNLLAGKNLGFLPSSSEIIVIPVNLQIVDKENLSLLSSNYLTFRFDLRKGPLEFPDENGIFRIFPNPFIVGQHQRIFFDFTPSESQDVEVNIFSSDGRIVKKARLQEMGSFLSQSNFSWNGKNENDEIVSSGIYIIQLRQGSFVDIKKFAVIRK
jgi:hypothetical protein